VFLSLAYILSDQKEKATKILEKIVNEKKYKAKESKKLLKKVK